MQFREKLRRRAQKLELDTLALYFAFKRQDTPLLAKVIIGIAVCYALSPIDLIPDFIPVIGLLDDLLLLPLLVMVAVKLIPKPVWQECYVKAQNKLGDGKPKSFWYALPVIVIWLVLAAVVFNVVLKFLYT